MKRTLIVAAFFSIILVSFALVGCGSRDDTDTQEQPPTHTIQLHEPTGLAINWDSLVTTWEQVENATGYEARVRSLSTLVDMPIISTAETTINLTNLNLTYGAYAVYIRAIGQRVEDTLYRDSEFTAGRLFAVRQAIQIPTLSNLRLDGEYLRWNTLPYVGPVQSYTITAVLPDGSQRNFFRTLAGFSGILPTEFYLTELQAGITQVSISATVLSPDGVITLTSPQTPITLFPDAMLTNVRVEDGRLFWNEITGATEFSLRNVINIDNNFTLTSIMPLYQGIQITDIIGSLPFQFQNANLDFRMVAHSTTELWTVSVSEFVPLIRL